MESLRPHCTATLILAAPHGRSTTACGPKESANLASWVLRTGDEAMRQTRAARGGLAAAIRQAGSTIVTVTRLGRGGRNAIPWP